MQLLFKRGLGKIPDFVILNLFRIGILYLKNLPKMKF